MIPAAEPLVLPDELPVLRAGRKAPRVELSEEERHLLRRRARGASTSQRDAFRARIILLADQGRDNRAIARQLDCDEDTVGKWRKRLAEHGPKGLRDLPRSGRPRTFSAELVTRVLQKATQAPREAGVPFSHWDAPALQRLAIEAGITSCTSSRSAV
jgi:transposase